MSIADKLKKYDKPLIGVITAFILLFVGYIVAYFIISSGVNMPFSRFVDHTFSDSPYRMDILIISILPNMILFYFTNFQWQLYNFIRGQVMVSVLYTLMIVFLSI